MEGFSGLGADFVVYYISPTLMCSKSRELMVIRFRLTSLPRISCTGVGVVAGTAEAKF